MKSQLLNNRVQLNLACFFNDFEDKQEQAVQLDSTTNTVATVFSNVANATYQGIEVELQWVVSENISLFASFGWLDAEYDEFETDIIQTLILCLALIWRTPPSCPRATRLKSPLAWAAFLPIQ